MDIMFSKSVAVGEWRYRGLSWWDRGEEEQKRGRHTARERERGVLDPLRDIPRYNYQQLNLHFELKYFNSKTIK